MQTEAETHKAIGLPVVKGHRFVQVSDGWKRFIDFCANMGYGEIEKVKIQNGVPMMAEIVTEKVKFS